MGEQPAVHAENGPGLSAALEVLESAWRRERGYCLPNAQVYPHMWLWDSCFHSIAWTSLHDRERNRRTWPGAAESVPQRIPPAHGLRRSK